MTLVDLDVPSVSADDLEAAAVVVAQPMRVRFRGIDVREAVLLRGPAGWAEFSPFPEYGDAEAARWLAAAIEQGWSPQAPAVRSQVGVNATVPAIGPGEVEQVLSRFDGARTAKVKVAQSGQSLADDLARVAEVRAVLGPSARIRVDANGSWSPRDAVESLTALARYDLEYAEQPCASVSELAQVRTALAAGGVDVPIAADESVRRAEDPVAVARAGAADLVVVKVAPLGGVRAALAVVEEAGLPAVVSSALDTSVGIAAGVKLAATLPQLDHDCGLGTVGLFTDDVSDPPLRPIRGSIGLSPAQTVTSRDLSRLDQMRITGERADWWLDRLRRCAALL